ncbi:MAG TPA: glycosyltransferase 87 family protein [Thermoleophilaceae bacterium]
MPARFLRAPPTAFVAAAVLVALSLLLRAPVFGYDGPPRPHPMNLFLIDHAGSYSDIAHLYFRDRLWEGSAPYFDYRFEYPVLSGAFVWLASLAGGSLGHYMLISTALMLCLALLTVWALGKVDGANPWVFALAPALAFYAVLNWDLLGVFLLVLALLLFQRERDLPATVVLALATSAKLFPIVVLPIVVALRAAERGRRSSLRIVAVFAVVTLAVNAPFAIGSHGIRDSWLYFFRFTVERPPRATIWKPVLGHGTDFLATPLIVAGLATILVLALRNRRRPGGVLIPASTASLLWVFAMAKVYSPQYALWIFALLAIDGAPLALAVAFAAVDILLFTTTFGPLYPGLPLHAVQWFADGLRQVVTAGLAVWVVRRQLLPETASREEEAVAGS